MPPGYTPDFAPEVEPDRGGVPDDVDLRATLLATLFRLHERAQQIGLNPERTFRYTLICRRSGLGGDMVLYWMRKLIGDRLAYSERNAYGLTHAGMLAGAEAAGYEGLARIRRYVRSASSQSR